MTLSRKMQAQRVAHLTAQLNHTITRRKELMHAPTNPVKVPEIQIMGAPHESPLIVIHAYYTCATVPVGFEPPPLCKIENVKVKIAIAIPRECELAEILREESLMKLGVKLRLSRTGKGITSEEKDRLTVLNEKLGALLGYEGLDIENIEWDHRYFVPPAVESDMMAPQG
jgi:hypothetical protein